MKNDNSKKKSLEGVCKKGIIISSNNTFFEVRFSNSEVIKFVKKNSSFYEKPFDFSDVLCVYSGKEKTAFGKVYGVNGGIYYLT